MNERRNVAKKIVKSLNFLKSYQISFDGILIRSTFSQSHSGLVNNPTRKKLETDVNVEIIAVFPLRPPDVGRNKK